VRTLLLTTRRAVDYAQVASSLCRWPPSSPSALPPVRHPAASPL